MIMRPLPQRRAAHPPVILITLKRTPERTEEALAWMRGEGITPHILWATDGSNDETAASLPRDPKCVDAGHQMQPGEVGCAMSWWRAAAMIVRNDWKEAVVFEDDFTPTTSIRNALDKCSELSGTGYHLALLHNQNLPEPTEYPTGHTRHFRRVKNSSWTTVSVLMSNAGARAILRSAAPFDRPIDCWIRDNPNDLIIYQPYHGWFEQNQWRPSTIRKTHGAGQIPKMLHRIWLGPNPVPEEYELYWLSWQQNHPGWEYRTWRDVDLEEFRGDVALCHTRQLPLPGRWAAMSDVLRLLILKKYGGLYVDTDFECFHTFQRLVDSAGLLLADMTAGDVCNGIMASVPKHPMLVQMINEATDAIVEGKGNILEQAGPAMVKRVLAPWRSGWPKVLRDARRKHVATAIGDTAITIVEPWVCFPYYWTDQKPKTFGDAWAAHHWARSWWTAKEWDEHRNHLRAIGKAA